MRSVPSRVWFALLPLAGGIGLVAYLLASLSLVLGIALAVAVGSLAAWAVWRKTPMASRRSVRRRALVGVVAGAAATLGYDLSRLVLVNLLGFSFWPFDVFTVFGNLLLGTRVAGPIAKAGGLLFHYCNGIGFAVAFVFLFRSPGILLGLLWAGILEFFMVSLYPSWLKLQAWNEFLSVSILGHAVYGLVLGAVARYGLTKRITDRA